MSLVAYASSEDESGSEQGDAETERLGLPDSKSPEKAADIPISDDDDDYAPMSETTNAGLSLPAPRKQTSQKEQSFVEQKVVNSGQSSFLSALPKPKAGSGGQEEEDEIEDFVKKNTEKLKASAQVEAKPKPQKRKIIKIAAPELRDSDSDEEQPKAKKSLPLPSSGKKCGLFSVLPAPKNRSLGAGRESKEGDCGMFEKMFNKSKPSANAKTGAQPAPVMSSSPLTTVKASVPFVPASLTRKPKQSSRAAFNLETGMMMAQPQKKASKKEDESRSVSAAGNSLGVESHSSSTSSGAGLAGVPLDGDSSDDEGADQSNSLNFFALGSSGTGSNPLSANSLSVTASVSTLPSVGNKDSDELAMEITEPSLQDQPLSFKPRDSGMHFKSAAAHYQCGSSAGGVYNNAYYNMAGTNVCGEGAEGQGTFNEEPAQASYSGSAFAQDEEFLKMQGKNKRVKEEINIIDVRQDDQMAEVDVNLIKHMSEENSNRMSASKKKNDDMPTSQQRKKHQITYLAFKAKEREIDLKDAWAANRQTKRQTQSKYGF